MFAVSSHSLSFYRRFRFLLLVRSSLTPVNVGDGGEKDDEALDEVVPGRGHPEKVDGVDDERDKRDAEQRAGDGARPPKRLAPPITQAAITVSSTPTPARGPANSSRAVRMRPAIAAAITAQITKVERMTPAFVGMPASLAAASLPPVA